MKYVTQWFYKESPEYVGIYEVKVSKSYDAGYAHWNGKRWGMSEKTKSLAKKNPLHYCAIQNKIWRGLANKPKGK